MNPTLLWVITVLRLVGVRLRMSFVEVLNSLRILVLAVREPLFVPGLTLPQSF